MAYEMKKIKKARRVPTQREMIRAARQVLNEPVGRISVGMRQNEVGRDVWDATFWKENADLSDNVPITDFLADARYDGFHGSVRVADLYVYDTDDFQDLISNLSMVCFGDDWFLTEEHHTLDWDRKRELYKKGELIITA
jgi:hypothetical protein